MARTERYLPAKSRVVVKTKNHPAKWYNTQKDVVLVNDEAAICPITAETENIRVTTVESVHVYFQSRMIRTRVVLEEGDVNKQTFNEQFSIFHYDVPSAGESAGYSPCNELYRVAVRLSKSAWIVKSGDVPYDLMGRMQDMGCLVFCNRFDKGETSDLTHQAVRQLMLKMEEATKDAETSYAAARTQLTNSSNPDHKDYMDDETKAVERFNKRCLAIEKRLEKMAEDINVGASKFGISTKAYGHSQLAGMKVLTHTRAAEEARAYHRATVIASTSTDSNLKAVATQAANSEIPVAVLSDMLRDAGEDAAADELNTTFRLTDGNDEDAA